MRNVEFQSPVSSGNRSSGIKAMSFSSADYTGFSPSLPEGALSLDDVKESDYHQLSPAQRMAVYAVIIGASGNKKKPVGYRLLKARFDPANQYRVKISHRGKVEVFECFKYEGNYHTGPQLYINTSHITEVVCLSA